jgi:hypothetical protein
MCYNYSVFCYNWAVIHYAVGRASAWHGLFGTPGFRAGPTRSWHGRVVLGHTSEHVGRHGPARSINGSCLARHYLDRAETGSGRVRAG